MIWHIFAKDARLLWPIAALVAVLQVCAAIPQHLIDHGMRTSQLAMLADLLPALALLGIMVMVVVVLQQDPVPGARQDWLIRPIRRSDLALAKLLFVLLMVQLPLWVVDVGAALADGFAWPAAAAAAAARNLQVLCLFALPSMVLGALTRTFVEALIVTIVVWVGFIAIIQFVMTGLLGLDQSLGDTGAAWLFFAAFDVLALVGSVAVLAVLYSRRRTILARWLTGVAAALLMCVLFVPWPVAFSIQKALSPQPTAAHPIKVAFDPRAGRYRIPAGAASSGASTPYVPLRFSGLPEDSSLLVDRADIRITGLDGTTLYVGKLARSFDGITMVDDRLEVRADRGDGGIHPVPQRVALPAQLYGRLADRQVRIEIDYSLTLFGPAGTYSLPTTSPRRLLTGLGRCRTGIDPEGDDVSIGCLSTTRQPPCLTVYLEHPATGLKNPESHICNRDYGPALLAKFWPDEIHRMGGEVRFFDFSGMARFPVDGSKVAAARLIIKAYDVRGHFFRHVETPLVRLADLAPLGAPPR